MLYLQPRILESWELFFWYTPWGGYRVFSARVVCIVSVGEIRSTVQAWLRRAKQFWKAAPRWKRGRFKAKT